MAALAGQLATLTRQLEQGMEAVSRALAEAHPLAARIQVSLAQAGHQWTQWTGQVKNAATRLDETLDLAREKFREFDRAAGRAMNGIQTRTTQAQRSILRPSVELPAIVEGLRTGVRRYVKEIRGQATQSKASNE
jgi:ABC-type transporter Mla subunit MlaD